MAYYSQNALLDSRATSVFAQVRHLCDTEISSDQRPSNMNPYSIKVAHQRRHHVPILVRQSILLAQTPKHHSQLEVIVLLKRLHPNPIERQRIFRPQVAP
jgi:hypothetical protein